MENLGNFLVNFIVATLATYRVAHMIALEEGPFAIFAKIREYTHADFQVTWWQRGMICPVCISFWISLVICLLLGMNLLEWLAVAGAVLIVHIAAYK